MIKKFVLLIPIILVLTGCTPAPLVSQPLAETSAPSPSAIPTASPSVTPYATAKPILGLPIISLPSTFRSDATRPLSRIDTVVIHSLYNPTTADHFAIANIKQVLDESQVSSHFVIARDGQIYQLVPEIYQAWQAGVSAMPAPDNRTGVNAFSIGIELVGNETSGFTAAQYTALGKLLTQETGKLPIKNIVGHSDIAPGRKSDPWKFDWGRLPAPLYPLTALHAK